jgi:hypothetical protein
MAQYGPHSFKVRTTLAAYRIVIADTAGSDFAVYPSAATARPIGITMDTVKDTTSAIPVAGPGMMARLLFNDTMSSGSLVAADSSGRGVPHVDTTAGSYVIGHLVGPAIAATGTIAEVLINPFFKSIP